MFEETKRKMGASMDSLDWRKPVFKFPSNIVSICLNNKPMLRSGKNHVHGSRTARRSDAPYDKRRTEAARSDPADKG